MNGKFSIHWLLIQKLTGPPFANMLRQDPGGPHVGPMNLAIWEAIIWTNAVSLSIWPLRTNFSQIVFEIQIVSFKKMHLKMLFGKYETFCPYLNMLNFVSPHYAQTLTLGISVVTEACGRIYFLSLLACFFFPEQEVNNWIGGLLCW